MSKTLWNEGRVCGYSLYEIYLRYLATEAPDVVPVSEKEFMSSMITMGNSLLLRVGTDDISGVHYREIPLPSSSNISATNTIIGSFFAGKGAVASDSDSYTGWATRVTDYGPLIENNETSSPSGDIIPPTNPNTGDVSDEIKEQIPEYLKIIDGIVLQPGTWSTSELTPPTKDFKPNMNRVPIVRISFSDKVEKPFYLLLTGFSAKLLTLAVSGTESSLDTDAPSDGDFLGPWVYPWANKIIFSIPPMFASYIDAVKVATEDIAKLQIYNTRYIWLYRMADGSGAPSQADLQDSRSIYVMRGVTGVVSDYFISEFCVDYDTAVAACAEGHISDGLALQKSCIDQIVYNYGEAQARNRFKYFFWSNSPSHDSASQNGMFYPVDIQTKQFAFAITDDTLPIQVDHGINFSASDVVVDGITMSPTNTDIMGGLFNRANSYSDTSVSEMDSDGGYVFENHPVLHNVVKDFPVFTRAKVAVPKAPSQYNYQFVDWFEATPVTAILSTETIQVMGLHSDYTELDFQSFLQYAAAQRDLTQPMDASMDDTSTINALYYIYSASDITTVADNSFVWSDAINAEATASAQLSRVDYYRPADLKLIKTQDDIDITSICTDSSYHIWASTATSSKSQTKSISLIDNFGSPLPTAGSSGSIVADTIKWEDLLNALNRNRSIDVLGGLINMKNSGSNYIQLGGIRLYISAVAPTDDIPDGALGIGWGSGIYKYTSGAWASL